MLRLKQCLTECGVPQQQLVAASGWSKSLVSRALNTGDLPRDAEKFRHDVVAFALAEPRIIQWLNDRGLPTDSLLDLLPPQPAPLAPAANPEAIIARIAGEAVIVRPEDYDVIRLAQAAYYLYIQATYYAGLNAGEIRAETAAILGGAP